MPKKIQIIFIILIFLLGIFFRIWNLGYHDLFNIVFSDAPVHAARSLGWLDYFNQCQTAPIQWFGEIPWWANLSFHDHPPLFFLVHNIFFKIFTPIFGPLAVSARLPGVIFSLISGLILYFFVKRYRNEAAALLALFIWSISSFSTWLSRSVNLETVEIFFIVLSLLFFFKYITENKTRYLFLTMVCTGLALISKYTAIFILPSILFFLLIYKREIFKKKEFWLSIGTLILIVSPVIFYNIMLFITRGHFDAQISLIAGINSSDFGYARFREIGANFLHNIYAIPWLLLQSNSILFLTLFFVSFLYICFRFIKKRSDQLEFIVVLNIVMILLMFICFPYLNEDKIRYMTILLPFFVVISALFINDCFILYHGKSRKVTYLFAFVLMIIFSIEIFYNINTNVLSKPLGNNFLVRSFARLNYFGLNDLDRYIFETFISSSSNKMVRNFTNSIDDPAVLNGKIPIFYLAPDNCGGNCFWYAQKYLWYYNYPIMEFDDFLKSVPAGKNYSDYLKELGLDSFIYISLSKNFIFSTLSVNPTSICSDLDDQTDEKIKLRKKPEIFELIEVQAKSGVLIKEIENNYSTSTIKIYQIYLN